MTVSGRATAAALAATVAVIDRVVFKLTQEQTHDDGYTASTGSCSPMVAAGTGLLRMAAQ